MLHRWKSETRKFGFIKRVKKLTFRALALRQSEYSLSTGQRSKRQLSKSFTAVIQPFTVIISRDSAREAPLVRKIGNPSSRENLVMTSLYDRPSFVQTLGDGEGRLNVTCDFGCSQLIRFIYLFRSLSHQNYAKSELVSTQQEWYYRVKYMGSTMELRFCLNLYNILVQLERSGIKCLTKETFRF